MITPAHLCVNAINLILIIKNTVGKNVLRLYNICNTGAYGPEWGRAMQPYAGLAGVYDVLMRGVPPKKWADYIESLWNGSGIKPRLILDLACGTGRVSRLLSSRGYEVTGVDASSEMLAVASRHGGKVQYIQQDMRELDLYGTYDAIICLCDSVNYITEPDELRHVFGLAYNYLNPGGMFVFDVNTDYKYRNILGSNTFCRDVGGCAYIWENRYDRKSKLNEYNMAIFVRMDGGLYERFDESHLQRAYDSYKLQEMLSETGFENMQPYDAFTLDEPKSSSERVFFTAKKGEKANV